MYETFLLSLKTTASAAAMFAISVGLSSQIFKHYNEGACHFSSLLNIPFFVAALCRGIYFLLSGEYILLIPDMIGCTMGIIIQFQIAGFLLKREKDTPLA